MRILPPMDRVRVAVVGASGYTGAELVRLLLGHPRAQIAALVAKERVAPRAGDVLPSLRGVLDHVPIERFDPEQIAARADVAFCALPHGASVEAVRALHARSVRVFDLSADFRLTDAAVYAHWYGAEHGAPELLPAAIYGLAELNRSRLHGATLVAVPGCYPTASTLPLLPLFERGLARTDQPVIVHALSGVSGGGRSPAPAYHFPETSEGVRPYKIAGSHRHTPEIEQTLAQVAGCPVTVSFTPTLVPMTRGILATAYVEPQGDVTLDSLVTAARQYFAPSPSVTVLDPGQLPDTLWVRGSNRAHVAYALDRRARRIVAMCAIDNLVKGAAGQAIQCMNLALGHPEGEGLAAPAAWP